MSDILILIDCNQLKIDKGLRLAHPEHLFDITIPNQAFKTFGIQMGSQFECLPFEPPLYCYQLFSFLDWQPCSKVPVFFMKVLKKFSIFFIFLVISCCVVNENVCNRRVNTQGLSLKRFYGLPSVNHYHSSYTNCTITETDSHGLRLLLVKCYDNKT